MEKTEERPPYIESQSHFSDCLDVAAVYLISSIIQDTQCSPDAEFLIGGNRPELALPQISVNVRNAVQSRQQKRRPEGHHYSVQYSTIVEECRQLFGSRLHPMPSNIQM